MKTEVKTRIITHVDAIAFGYWDTEKEAWVEPKSTEDIKVAAEKLHCSPDIIAALISSTELLVDAISGDLRDIWKRPG